MWTSIRSRLGSALTLVAVLLTMILVVTALLFVLVRTFPPQWHSYQTYSLDVTPSGPWHPGQPLSLQWAPGGGGTVQGEPPSSVVCQFSLYGPYSTSAEAQANLHQPPDGPTPAASAPPLTLFAAMGATAPPAVAYALPATLASGYYVAEGYSGGGGASWVVQVAA
jgi:hypothetical protein